MVESFAIAKDGDLICLPVKLNGKEYPFILDTGATHTLFDESLRPDLGEPLQTERVNAPEGKLEIDLFVPPPARIGELLLPADQPVACIDLSGVRQAADRDFYGVLGVSLLERLVVQIDFDEGTVLILQGRPVRTEDWGESIPFVRDRPGYLWIMASVDENTREPFLIDTGFTGTGGLRQALFEQLDVSARLAPVGEVLAERAGGRVRRLEGQLAEFSVGPFRHRDLLFMSGESNLVGLGYLRRYRVTIDFPEEKMYLKKGRAFSCADHAGISGLHLLRNQGVVEVHSVDEGSPADVAGVRPKDVIVEFQGKPACSFDLFTIRRLLRSADGESIGMTVKRDEKEVDVNFKLKQKQPQSNAPKRE